MLDVPFSEPTPVERPAVKTALAKVEELGALVTVLDKGGPQDVDRLFGCGQFAVA
jgi:hypothetical protein